MEENRLQKKNEIQNEEEEARSFPISRQAPTAIVKANPEDTDK